MRAKAAKGTAVKLLGTADEMGGVKQIIVLWFIFFSTVEFILKNGGKKKDEKQLRQQIRIKGGVLG